jgi:hypothetical protein
MEDESQKPTNWITGKEALEICKWRSPERRKSKGVEKPFREWLASIGVPCTKWAGSGWLVDGDLLEQQLQSLQTFKAAGLNDSEVYEILEGFELREDLGEDMTLPVLQELTKTMLEKVKRLAESKKGNR